MSLHVLYCVEDRVPTIRDINRYVTRKHAADWKDIGIELGLHLATLNIIEKDHPLKSEDSFIAMIDKWIQLTGDDATWKVLEVALTNVNRQKLDFDPVDDVYGKLCSVANTYNSGSMYLLCGIVNYKIVDIYMVLVINM